MRPTRLLQEIPPSLIPIGLRDGTAHAHASSFTTAHACTRAGDDTYHEVTPDNLAVREHNFYGPVTTGCACHCLACGGGIVRA
jgi:hypothetical protein